MVDKKKRKKKKKKVKITLMDRVKQFQSSLLIASSILATLIYFFGFVALDTEKFKQTDLTVASAMGLLFIEWDLGDTPDVPTEIIYYIDGIQFANEIYPTGLKEAVGIRTKYVSSYVLPPIAYIDPGEHDFKAVAVFNGWSTLFSPKTVTFSTTFESEDRTNENNSNSNSNFISPGDPRSKWAVKIFN